MNVFAMTIQCLKYFLGTRRFQIWACEVCCSVEDYGINFNWTRLDHGLDD